MRKDYWYTMYRLMLRDAEELRKQVKELQAELNKYKAALDEAMEDEETRYGD